jgi:hypothetical protein
VPRGLVALFALLEALFVVALGILVTFAFAILAWVSLTGVSTTPLDVWQLSIQVWALGHGIPLTVTLDDASAVLTDGMATFDLTLAPFAFALVTVLLGRRAGRRLAGSDDATLVIGLLVVIVGGLVGLALASGRNDTVDFDVASGTIRILAPFVVGLVIGWKPWLPGNSVRRSFPAVPDAWRDVIDVSASIAGATMAGLVAIASFGLMILVVLGYATVVSLYESLHTEILGGFVITAAQIALVPVAVVWMVAWIAGPGFAIGTGSVVSPFATTVGAVPAVPLLGIIPTTTTVGGWVTVVPALIALIAAIRFAPAVETSAPRFTFGNPSDLGRLAAVAGIAASGVGLATCVIGSYASGSAGPGRFANVGVEPIGLGLTLAGGVFVGALVGLVIGKVARDSNRVAAV